MTSSRGVRFAEDIVDCPDIVDSPEAEDAENRDTPELEYGHASIHEHEDHDDDSATGFVYHQIGTWFALSEHALSDLLKNIKPKRLLKKKKTTSHLSGDEIMADGPWQCNPPRARREGDTEEILEKEKQGYGVITREETLWMILISLSFAKNRDEIEENHDVMHYVLHYFVLWTVLFSCILYSARFNDRDFFHTCLWNLVMIGLVFLVGAMDEPSGSVTMGWSACAVHLAISFANARVAMLVPHAEVYGFWMAFQSLVNAIIMACITFVDCRGVAYHVFLGINVVLQPFMYTLYKAFLAIVDTLYEDEGFSRYMHVPADFSYIFRRWQGMHSLAIIGGFFSSIALYGGPAILISTDSRIVACCAFIYALLLKTCVLDVDLVNDSGYDSRRHPYRYSYVTSRIFLLLFPYDILCILITGLGFYIMTLDSAGLAPHVIGENTQAFARKLMTIGPAVSWGIMTTNKAMTRPRFANIHWPKVVSLYILSASYLVPALLEFGNVSCAVWVLAVQFFMLAVMVISMFLEEACRRHELEQVQLQKKDEEMSDSVQSRRTLAEIPSDYGTWDIKVVRLIQDWEDFEKNKNVGPQIDPHELFSTVLLGVSLETMQANIEDSNTLNIGMGLWFVTMYGSFSMVMRYSARFSLRDMSHRFGWTVYQFAMLLQIIGMRTNHGPLFNVASAIQYCWIAVIFWLRIAWQMPRCRIYASYSIIVCLVLAAIVSLGYHAVSGSTLWFMFICILVISLGSEPMFNLATWYLLNEEDRKTHMLPMNVEYLNNRFNGSFITITSVCILKSGCEVFWGSTNHPGLAFACVVCIALMAMAIMSAHFHTDVVSSRRHAIRRGEISGMLYLFLHPCILVSMALLGCFMMMLLTSIGQYGFQSYNPLAKNGLCMSSAAFKFFIASCQNLHKSKTHASRNLHEHSPGIAGETYQRYRTSIFIFSCVLSLFPILMGSMMLDFATLIYITSVATFTRTGHLIVNWHGDYVESKLEHEKEIKRKELGMHSWQLQHAKSKILT